MEVPKVDPVGILRYPEDWNPQPRAHSPALRFFAALLVLTLASVIVVTTAVSLGAYCLTTDTNNTSALPKRPVE